MNQINFQKNKGFMVLSIEEENMVIRSFVVKEFKENQVIKPGIRYDLMTDGRLNLLLIV